MRSNLKFSQQIWTRIAANIKDNGLNRPKSSALVRKGADKYLDTLEAKTSGPEASIGMLENELREEVAAALGRTASKINSCLIKLEEYRNLGDAISYERTWKEAERAKWELMIHRQAVGFIFKNAETVDKLYPLPPRSL